MALVNNANEPFNSERLEASGRTLYRTNEHFRRLGNVMEHPEFREFLDSYFQDRLSAETMVIFMETYRAVEAACPGVSGYQKIALVREAMDDAELRPKLVSRFRGGLKMLE